MIEQAEDFLYEMGFSQFRVRIHGKTARIELAVEELEKAIAIRERVVEVLKNYGFSYIILDLDIEVEIWMKCYEIRINFLHFQFILSLSFAGLITKTRQMCQ